MNGYLIAVWLAIQDKLLVLVILTALDILLGIVLGLIKREFKWDKLTTYLSSDGLPILGWLVVVMVTLFPKEVLPNGFTIPVVADFVYVTVFGRIFGSLMKSLSDAGIFTEMFGKLGIESDKPKG